MRSRRLMAWFVVGAVACACWAPGARGEEHYAIKMDRQLKKDVPLKFRKVVAARWEVHATINGKALPVEVKSNALEFHGRFTILEVDRSGYERKNEYEVERFILVEGDQERELLPPGSKLMATAGKDGATFVIENGPDWVRVNPQMQWYLRRVIGLRTHDGGPTGDEIYGTAERKKVGESWGVDAEKLARSFSGPNMAVKAADVAGKTTLAGVEEKDGVRCLKLQYETTMENVKFKPAPGATPTGGKRASKFEGLLPIDLESPLRLSTLESTEDVTFEEPGPREGVVVKKRAVLRYTHVHEVGAMEEAKERGKAE